jgi:hypothetical protein
MVHPLPAEFEWAGIHFPKWLWSLPRGSKAKRLADAKRPVCGPYYHSPKPGGKGAGFYLGDCKWGVAVGDGNFALRAKWCDEVDGVRINHTGWFTDEFGDGDKIRGLVFRLPRGRGFLAGWSMGEGMCGSVDFDIYDTEAEAARAADSMAENQAEAEREAEAKFRAEQEAQEAEQTQLAEVFP